MHFHYRVATTLSLLILVSFVFQLIAVLSVPVTSSITLCTYDGYKFGVFGLCSIKTNTCSDINIGYSKTTVELLKGFSLPSNTRHSISNLLIVHPISTGFTFILLIMSLLTHFKIFNRSLRFLFCLILWCFVTFLLCLLSFLVDILLFVPHLDWGGWIVLASTVLVAIGATIASIMRRTASSRNLYDSKRRNENNSNVEMYSMLPLKESYGFIRNNDDVEPLGMISDSEKENESDHDLTNQHLLYDDDASTQPTDVVSSLPYRGYQQGNFNNNNNNINKNFNSPITPNVIKEDEDDADDDDGYYNYNPMMQSENFNRSPGNALISKRNSLLSQNPPPGRSLLPYPIDEPYFENDNIANNISKVTAPYPAIQLEDDFEEEEEEEEEETDIEDEKLITLQLENQQLTPTIPRVDTPPMDESTYEPQPMNITPLRGPRPIPLEDDLPPIPDKIPLEPEQDEDEFIFLDSRNVSGNSNKSTTANFEFKKPMNNHTQTTFTTTTNSTLAHNNLNSVVAKNHDRFVSNNSTVPASSYYGDESDVENSTDFKSGASLIEEVEESHDEIPSSEYLDLNEDNLSNYSRLQEKSLLKKLSMDSIASSNFTSISQRPVNPRYYENKPGSQRTSIIQPKAAQHPFRAQLGAKLLTKEEKLKKMRQKLSQGEF